MISILGNDSLLTDINNLIVNIFTVESNLLGNNQGQINTLLNNTNPYESLIKFLNNFYETKYEDISSSSQFFDLTNNTINYNIQDINESNDIRINMDKLITYFKLDNRNIYKELINTVDKLYDENKKIFTIKPNNIIKTNGTLIENRTIQFPLFTTKDYSYLYKSIDQINTEFKRRRINNNIIKINFDILIDEIQFIVYNIENLNPDVNMKDVIFNEFDFLSSDNTSKEDFDKNLKILDRNVEQFYNKFSETDSSEGVKMGIDSAPDSDDEELQKAMAMSMQKDPDDAMDTEGKKDSAPDSEDADIYVSSPPRRSPRLTQPKNQFSALTYNG